MLVLSRKRGEQVVLPGCEVTVTVLAISGGRVRLGIVAPSDTLVHRRETWDKIANTETAATPDPRPPDEAAASLSTERSPLTADGASEPDASGSPQHRLADHIRRLTHDRVHGLRIEAHGDSLIVHGRTSSYYARQLVQVATREFLQDLSPTDAAQRVAFEIDVARA